MEERGPGACSEERGPGACEAKADPGDLGHGYDLLATYSPDIILFVRFADGRIREANQAAIAAYGYTRGELLERTVFELRTPELVPNAPEQMQRADREGIRFETIHRRKDGSTFPVEVSSLGATFEGERWLLSVVRDISERRRAEEKVAGVLEALRKALADAEQSRLDRENAFRAVAERERRLRLLIEHTPAAVAMFDRDMCYLAVSRRYAAEYGVREPEILGRNHYEVFPDIPSRWRDVHRRCLAGAVERCEEDPFLRLDGALDWIRWEIRPWYDSSDEIGGIILFSELITETKNSVEKIAAERERLAVTLRCIGDGVIATDEKARITIINTVAEELTGWAAAEAVGRPLEQVFRIVNEETREILANPVDRVLREGTVVGLENPTALISRDGTERPIADSGAPIRDGDGRVSGVVLVFRDQTAERSALERHHQLAAKFEQAQKLESVGRLAGGVAHDFNNLLTVILGCAGELKRCLDRGDPPTPADVEEILAAGRRGSELTTQLLTFARKQVTEPTNLQLNAVIAKSEKILRRVLGEDIRLTIRAQEPTWTVRCDPGQIAQIIMNLAVNARDAMPQGGALILETANTVLAPSDVLADHGERPGEYVRLTVSDSGEGMSEEVKAHLFEPFVTTKPMGRGTGLGLASVYGIVKQGEGIIRVRSELHRGTTFDLYFPHAFGKERAEPPPLSNRTSGSETILVVEDDPAVREITVRVLRSAGYHVRVARDPHEALALSSSELDAVQLLISDVIMPDLDGKALSERLVARNGHLRVLFISGYADEIIAERGVLDAGTAFLAKPFTRPSLLSKVRGILEEARDRSPP